MDKSAIKQASLFIAADIAREVALADASERTLGRIGLRLASVPSGGGNFVAALALLSYTEFAGRLKNNDFSDNNSRKNFNSFFESLGPDYKNLLGSINVYKIFRCGLAHEYYVKKDCVIACAQHVRAVWHLARREGDISSSWNSTFVTSQGRSRLYVRSYHSAAQQAFARDVRNARACKGSVRRGHAHIQNMRYP